MKTLTRLIAALFAVALTLTTTPASAIAPTTLTFTSFPGFFNSVGGTYTPKVTSNRTSGQTPIVLSVSTPAVCQVNGATVELLARGTCTVVADQAATVDYLAGHATQSFRVS